MCRQYKISFDDCDHIPEERQEDFFRCAFPDDCKDPDYIPHLYQHYNRFCPNCLICNHNTDRRLEPNHIEHNSPAETAAAQAILAHAPDNAHYWGYVDVNRTHYTYDAWDIHFFSEDPLNEEDAEWLSRAERVLMTHIFQSWNFGWELTFNMLLLYLQLRDAMTSHEMRVRENLEKKEDTRTGAGLHEEMIRRLTSFVTPVPVYEIEKEDRECIICREEFGKPNEDGDIGLPVRVDTCTHVYCADCLHQWIREWDPQGEKEFILCTLCKKPSGLVPVLEPVEEPIAEIPSPWWVRLLQGT